MLDQIAKVNYKYSYSLANAIQSRGINIKMVIDQKQEQENAGFERVKLFNTDEKNVGKFSKLINYIRSYKKIYKMIQEEHIDVLHTQWVIFSPLDYWFLNKIKKKCGVRLVTTIHDILPFNEKFYDRNFHKKIYTLSDAIIVQAENNVKRFQSLFPELEKKVSMIPHGHFLEYAEIVDSSEAKSYLKLDPNKINLLFFGQIKKVKGVGILLEAFAKICSKYPNVQLIIAGSVWKDDFSHYQKIIDDNHMENQVITDIRYIPDEEIKYYYSAADVCMMPYTDVYQSGVIQLVYAYKKTAVATRIGAFKEVVIDGKTGFMCEPNDVDSLAKAIEKAIQNQSSLGEFGEDGYKYIKEKFSWDKIAEQIKVLYLRKEDK